MKVKTKWESTGRGNAILEGEGFFVSYNPSPGMGLAMFQSDTGGAETALCYNNRFDILNGDFRKDYEKIVGKGLGACQEFYKIKESECNSSWTTAEGK